MARSERRLTRDLRWPEDVGRLGVVRTLDSCYLAGIEQPGMGPVGGDVDLMPGDTVILLGSYTLGRPGEILVLARGTVGWLFDHEIDVF